jgi:EAL domain-containing protein (putative c-di-GMP-specific phosphodiesterase class I)
VVDASIGYAVCDDGQAVADQILSDAESAAHRAGSASARKYDSAFARGERRRVELCSALPRALDRNEFQLRYQPIVDLHTGQIVGAEALIRWMHTELGTVPPAEFVPLAETTDAVLALDRWVLREATREAASWEEAPVNLSVNISGRHLDDPRLPDRVAAILADTGLRPSRLRIEVTETAFVGDVERSVTVLQRLRELGISVAMDDFGTGYASFAQLADLPLDVLKIDRSLISRVGTDRRRNVLPGVISMAQQLGLEVVAEGIETRDQWNALRNLGCTFGQGFLFARPVPAHDFISRVRMQVRTDHATLPPKED